MKINELFLIGHSISYLEVNPEKTTSLVFIHGNSLSKEIFQEQMKSDLFSNFRLISFDLIGFGKSSKSTNPEQEYNVPFYAQLVQQLIFKMNLQNVYLVGHSLGGHIAIEFAGRYKNKLKGLICIGTPPLGIPADIAAAFQPNPVANLLFQPVLNNSESADLASNIANNYQNEKIIESIQQTDSIAREKIGESILKQNYLDEIEVLNNIEIPFALIFGSEDKLCNLNYLQKYQFKNQWKSTQNIIENGSHTPFLDQNDKMNHLIINFITSNE